MTRTTHSGLHSMYGEPYRRFGGQEHTAFRDPGRDVQIAYPITIATNDISIEYFL